ncbi:cytochrome c biogenesis protein CcdA [Sagittula sp. NFXS13]|uniref:cytochrome c biogenesis CcdA family protein n=1 Tax=Sagittula sp. NFXS13 TaxID=2819095 RepID=UPI0032DF62ED
MVDASFGYALFMGFLSFFSPCILPMVPFYLCYMAGLSMSELRADEGIAPGAQKRLIVSAIFFSLGVTTIFVLIGMAAAGVGALFADSMDILRYVAAAVLAIFGLHFLGVIRVPFLYREARMESQADPKTVLGAYAMGLAFGFGWTPCAGPAISAILAIAMMGSVTKGGTLLLVYGIGMTAPFVVAALFSGAFLRWSARHRDKLAYVEKVMGVMLLLFAVLIATNTVNYIAELMLRLVPSWGRIG